MSPLSCNQAQSFILGMVYILSTPSSCGEAEKQSGCDETLYSDIVTMSCIRELIHDRDVYAVYVH